MRILVLENHPQFGGGSEAVSLQLGGELQRRGHEIILAYEREGNMLPAYQAFATELWKMNLPWFGWRRLPETLKGARALAQRSKERRVDLIFTSHLGHLRDLGFIKFMYGIPVIYHLGLPLYDKFDRQRDSTDWLMRQSLKT